MRLDQLPECCPALEERCSPEIITSDASRPAIEQAAVVISSSRQKAVARQFIDFLKRPDAVRVLHSSGFAVPQTLLTTDPDIGNTFTYTLVAGCFAGLLYYWYWTGQFPPASIFDGIPDLNAMLFGFLAWLVVLGCL
jgi:ABC-type glycerol-3-phosphate transport system substrate-binding protein